MGVAGVSWCLVAFARPPRPALLLPNQWTMAGRLRTIQDTTGEFTLYTIVVHAFAWGRY